ncbi:MAG: respiratory nitrate reductase subunit gamma [Nitrospinae bacterium]|nr:respiratory nitrate reductase subunit gamma [Nitrospinota bacterium]
MSALSLFYAGISYAGAVVFFGGLAYKLIGYALTPSPLKIPLTPQPASAAGVAWKAVGSILSFRALWNGDRWTWVGGYGLHLVLVFVFIRHLRLFLSPVPWPLADVQPFALLIGALLPLPLVYLMARRAAVDRYRQISSGADYFALALLLLIGLSGLSLKFLFHADVVGIKEFLLGLMLLSPVEVPEHPAFLVHFSLVLVLGFYFPFSKLIHAGGVLLSPTTMQADDAPDVRHVNPWGGQ